MAESRFMIAAYEAELADDVTLQALTAMIADRDRRMSDLDGDTFEQLKRHFTDGPRADS